MIENLPGIFNDSITNSMSHSTPICIIKWSQYTSACSTTASGTAKDLPIRRDYTDIVFTYSLYVGTPPYGLSLVGSTPLYSCIPYTPHPLQSGGFLGGLYVGRVASHPFSKVFTYSLYVSRPPGIPPSANPHTARLRRPLPSTPSGVDGVFFNFRGLRLVLT